MMTVEDVQEILSIPLLGVIPESESVLRASNTGTPVTFDDGKPGRARLSRRGRAISWRNAGDALRQAGAPQLSPRVVRQSMMNLFKILFSPQRNSASVAKERLKIVLAHERAGRDAPDFLPKLQKELIDVVGRYVEIRDDMIRVNRRQGRRYLAARNQHRDRRRQAAPRLRDRRGCLDRRREGLSAVGGTP